MANKEVQLSPVQQKIIDALKPYEGMPNNEENRKMMKNTIFRVMKNDYDYSESILEMAIKLKEQADKRLVEGKEENE